MKTSYRNGLRTFAGVMAALVLAVPASAQQATPAQGADTAKQEGSSGAKVVLKVGGEEVTESDFNFVVEAMGPELKEAIKSQGRRPLGEQYATMVVLSQHAAAQKLDASPEFRRRLALQRLQWLAEAAVEQLEGRLTVTPEEVSKYYSSNPLEFEEFQVRQVVVRKRPEGSTTETSGLPPADARARAEEIRKALAEGKDWKTLAGEYQGSQSVFVVADPRAVRRGQFPEELNRVIFGLKDGDLSLPVETPQAFIVFQAAGRRLLTLEDASEEIETGMRRFKVQQEINELRGKAAIWMDEEFFGGAPSAPGP